MELEIVYVTIILSCIIAIGIGAFFVLSFASVLISLLNKTCRERELRDFKSRLEKGDLSVLQKLD